MQSAKQTTRCTRCKSNKYEIPAGVKTCVRCKADKARYQRTEVGRLKQQRSKYQWIKSKHGRELSRAHVAVYRAIKDGTLIKQPCQECGEENVDAHHHDYTRKLDVVWLCKQHHMEVHRALG